MHYKNFFLFLTLLQIPLCIQSMQMPHIPHESTWYEDETPYIPVPECCLNVVEECINTAEQCASCLWFLACLRSNHQVPQTTEVTTKNKIKAS